jgi:hypothetical protein
MCLVKNAFQIKVIKEFKNIYILILMVFNLNIVDVTTIITS